MQETQEMLVQTLGQEDPLEEGMAVHSSILAWRIPRTEESGGLQSTGSERVEHDWSDGTHACTRMCQSLGTLFKWNCPCPFPSTRSFHLLVAVYYINILGGCLLESAGLMVGWRCLELCPLDPSQSCHSLPTRDNAPLGTTLTRPGSMKQMPATTGSPL